MECASGSIGECLQHEPPFCAVACPFRLDVRDFVEKVQRGRFNAAYRVYLDTVGFPGIVAALCPEPCRGVCRRASSGGPICMRLLERAAADFARNREPNTYTLPPKPGKVAIIGAGISGLACALRLSTRKYDVTVFERTDRVGGRLHDLLPANAFLPEITRQFMHEKIRLVLNTDVRALDRAGADATYIATGSGGATFGVARDAGGGFASTTAGVFLGGSLTGAGTVQAIADGLDAGTAIEWYLKTGRMDYPRAVTCTRLEGVPGDAVSVPAIVPASGDAYSRDEAVREATRCLRCACDACARSCDLMEYFRKTPKRIAEEVQITVHPGSLDGNATVATRLISTCNQCGLCREVCPRGIDTGAILLAGHRAMRAKGAMPWAFHDFFLRDMASANGEARLARAPLGHATPRHLFFPGCQLGASDPRYVTEAYRSLLRRWPDTGLMLACCGAPAEWAGDEPLRDTVHARMREEWLALGRPVVVYACPTCRQVVRRYLPEMDGVFLYELLADEAPTPPADATGRTASVFDPCASRDDLDLQRAVRHLAVRAGVTLEPLPDEGSDARCCGWGGQVSIAHPPYARHVVGKRAAEGPAPYITYCSNCRDLFAGTGKPAWHILDIQYGLNGADRVPPTVTERRLNRLALRRQALEEFWKETCEMEPRADDLVMTPALRRKLDDSRILETDARAVIEHCEASGRAVVDEAAGTCCGYLQIGNITCWVEYRRAPDGGFELVNAYSHRMTIEER